MERITTGNRICFLRAGPEAINTPEVIKHLDIVDSTLAKQITHYVQPAIEKTIQRIVRHSIAKTRTYYDGQLNGQGSVPTI